VKLAAKRSRSIPLTAIRSAWCDREVRARTIDVERRSSESERRSDVQTYVDERSRREVAAALRTRASMTLAVT